MFKDSYNLPANSGVARILHLDPDRHVSRIVQSDKVTTSLCSSTNKSPRKNDRANGAEQLARCFFWRPGLGREGMLEKGKGCDFGYALAISSCEEANSVDACTVTASDAITAFAVPNPNYSSQSRRFFQVWLLFGLPRRADHSAYFGLAKVYLSQPFQPSTEANLESCSKIVNARFQCNWRVAMDQEPETQPVESLSLNKWEIKFFPFSHRNIHRLFEGADRYYK